MPPKDKKARGGKKAVDPRGKMPPPLKPKNKGKAKDAPRGKAAEDSSAPAKGKSRRSRRNAASKDVRGKMPPPDTSKKKTRRKREPEKPRPPHKPPIEPKIEGDTFRAGWVALVGRPNVGKSTILNQLLGQKIAATTHKPQTTRRNLLGMLHPEGAQILLLDTPGHHSAKGPLNRYMVQQVVEAIREADVVAYVVEGRDDDKITPGNERVLKVIKDSGKPVVVLLNKIDLTKNKNSLLVSMKAYHEALGEQVSAIVPISAVKRDGLDEAVKALGAALPPGQPFFERGQITDTSERAIAAEMLREKVMIVTEQELPYSAAVTIEAFEDERPRLVRIYATIHVERDSQKGIVIGKGGTRLKEIGQRARADIERMLDSKVYLDVRVRVTERWSERPRALAELGYGSDGGSR